MFARRSSVFLASVFLAGFAVALLTGAGALFCHQAFAGQTAPLEQAPLEQSRQELLQDGLDALADRQPDLAREFFDQLVEAFPGTPEAQRAGRELDLLGRAVAAPDAAAPDTSMRNSDAPQRTVREAPVTRSIAALRLDFVTSVGDRVFFAENSSNIGGRARAMLENQARWLKQRPDIMVKIIGRADDGGQPQVAKELSGKRAEAVRDQLIAGGLAANRIAVEARGDRDPLATCRTFMCQAQNRLTETLIVEPELGGAGSKHEDGANEFGEDGAGNGGAARGAAATDGAAPGTVAR